MNCNELFKTYQGLMISLSADSNQRLKFCQTRQRLEKKINLDKTIKMSRVCLDDAQQSGELNLALIAESYYELFLISRKKLRSRIHVFFMRKILAEYICTFFFTVQTKFDNNERERILFIATRRRGININFHSIKYLCQTGKIQRLIYII